MDDIICAGIVSYNPDIGKLKCNIDHIKAQVDKVIVYDNGSDNINAVRHLVIEEDDVTELISSDKNRGIAAALNQICQEALDSGYTWILTLDQDSECPNNLIDILKEYTSEKTAIVAPRIAYRNNEEYALQNGPESEEVPWVITSASFTNLAIWRELGGFDEELFIDKVDYDFCIRARQAGYRILRVNHIALMHELGNLKCRKIFGRTIYVTNHVPIRRYYMTRNSFYLRKKLHVRNHPWGGVIKNVVKIIVFEDRKMAKMKEINRGIKDGITLAHRWDRPSVNI